MSKVSAAVTRATAGITATLFPVILACCLGYTWSVGRTDFGNGVDAGMMIVGGLAGLMWLVPMTVACGLLIAKVNPLAGTALALFTPLPVLLLTSTPVDAGRFGILLVSTLTITFLLSVAFGGSKQKAVRVEHKNVASKPKPGEDPALAAFK